MSSDFAIRVTNVSKCYHVYDSPRDRLKQAILPRLRKLIGGIFPRFAQSKHYFHEFWALRDVSFTVNKGETVGIIGRNGSGKSTLLQLICGTLTPTSGEIEVNGRVAALLELGAGFNPEFSGRENVYLNAAIMGFSKEEVDAKYQDIVAFADIGDFLDQPVKTYSSGMYVRLAFATAINVNPDVLIVDEALAVGDMLFQAKCMARMREMMAKGVTVLFVSHDVSAVKALCQAGVLLSKGQMIEVGKAATVVDAYLKMMHLEMNRELANKTPAPVSGREINKIESLDFPEVLAGSNIVVSISKEMKFADGSQRYGEGGAKILDIKLLNQHREPVDYLEFKEDYFIQVAVLFEKALPTFCVGYSLRDLKGQKLIGAVTAGQRMEMSAVQPGDIGVMEIKSSNRLNAGIYTVSVGIELPVLFNQQHIFLDSIDDALVFKVIMPADPLDWFYSLVHIPTEFTYLKI